MSSVEEIQAAARKLRTLADNATPGICPDYVAAAVHHVACSVDIDCGHPGHDSFSTQTWSRYGDGPYLAAIRPAVGLALVAWLESEAGLHADDEAAQSSDGSGVLCENYPHALAIARLINKETTP
jgi:hypothetical protein